MLFATFDGPTFGSGVIVGLLVAFIMLMVFEGIFGD